MNKDFNEEEAFGMSSRMGANATEADIQNVEAKMGSMKKGPLAKVWDKVVQLWEAFKSPDTPKGVKTLIIGGLIYMVSPIDLVPDVIPVFGLLDDASVIGIVFSQFLRLAGSAAIGAVIVKLIDKTEIKKRAKEQLKNVFEKEEVKRSMKETIIKHDKGLTMADLESWDCEDGTVDFTAHITNKTERNVTLDILDSWNNIVVPDIEIEGEKVSDEITIGTEILLTA